MGSPRYSEDLDLDVDATILRHYQIPPFMVSHYGQAAAYRQKVEALASRRITQARDVFDLHLLVASGGVPEVTDGNTAALAKRAALNAMTIGFDVFSGQVLSHMHPDTRSQYDSADVWESMVLTVVRALEEAQP